MIINLHYVNAFLQKQKLYGWRIAMARCLSSIIRKLLGLSIEKYYILSVSKCDVPLPPIPRHVTIRPLVKEDLNCECWSDFFLPKKRELYLKRLEEKNIFGYGAFVNGILAYTCWLNYGEVRLSGTDLLFRESNVVLLFDDYCHPAYRCCGLHTYMIAWRLSMAFSQGIQKAYTIVIAFNAPSLKAEKRCGMEIVKTFRVLQIGRHRYRKQIFP